MNAAALVAQPPAAIIPDAKRIRRRDAEDLAAEIVDRARRCRCCVGLWLLPTGGVRTALRGTYTAARYVSRWPDSLVGFYGGAAAVSDVAADIREMERVL